MILLLLHFYFRMRQKYLSTVSAAEMITEEESNDENKNDQLVDEEDKRKKKKKEKIGFRDRKVVQLFTLSYTKNLSLIFTTSKNRNIDEFKISISIYIIYSEQNNFDLVRYLIIK